LLLAACGSTPMNKAPVVERSINPMVAAPSIGSPNVSATSVVPTVVTRPLGSVTTTSPVAPAPVLMPAPAKPITPVIDGKSHTVKRGDTLYAIALENGLSYRELAEWNGISNPSMIQADQVLRLTAPAGTVMPTAAVSSPVTVPVASPVSSPAPSQVTSPVIVPAPVVTVPAAPVAPVPVAVPGEVVWQWPVKGKLLQGFVDGKSKGLDIGGKTGDAINAAADGKVVYAGTGLKGYGQLVIIKHSDVYLTAYAHNSRLLVKEEQTVSRGQKIAEMGNTESDDGQTKLHFELRRSGKPVDPVKLLPPQ
jgi:lipoprotein NlpD